MTVLETESVSFYSNAHEFISETQGQKQYKQLTGINFKDEYEEYDDFLDIYECDIDLITAILDITQGDWLVSYTEKDDGFIVTKTKVR